MKTNRASKLAFIPGVSGKVLFLCMFFPAYRSCAGVAYPYDPALMGFWPPYLFGLAVAAWALFFVARHRKTPRWVAWGLAGACLLGLASTGILFSNVAGNEEVLFSAWIVIWIGALLFLAPVLSRARSQHFRATRSAAAGGLICLAWFLLWIIAPMRDEGNDAALWGTYLAAAASACITAGAVLLERAQADSE